jgi:hypothetical protein
MRPDHAKTNFVFHRYCGDLLHFIACASVARDRLFAAAAGVGVRSHFEVHFVRRVQAKSFPGPVKLSARVTVWRAEDVRRWISEQGQ